MWTVEVTVRGVGQPGEFPHVPAPSPIEAADWAIEQLPKGVRPRLEKVLVWGLDGRPWYFCRYSVGVGALLAANIHPGGGQ
jgi:hypothetical protein